MLKSLTMDLVFLLIVTGRHHHKIELDFSVIIGSGALMVPGSFCIIRIEAEGA